MQYVNFLRPEQNGHHFADEICILEWKFLNFVSNFIEISSKSLIDIMSTLFQVLT